MKKERILQAFCLCAGMAGVQSQAALLTLTTPSTSPFYADFGVASGLSVVYTSESSTTGQLIVTGNNLEYTDSKDSPGTGNGTTGAYNAYGFTGSYDLTANLVKEGNGNWDVSSGTITIDGNLLGNGNSDILRRTPFFRPLSAENKMASRGLLSWLRLSVCRSFCALNSFGKERTSRAWHYPSSPPV